MNVFTYGSLMFPEVWLRVTGQACASRPVRLQGYARYAVPGVSYPGMVAEPGAAVEGVLYVGVASQALERLDRFEGSEYLREDVVVACESGKLCSAQAYVWRDRATLASLPWNAAEFDPKVFLGIDCG